MSQSYLYDCEPPITYGLPSIFCCNASSKSPFFILIFHTSAQDHLQYLQQELATTRDDITDANDELDKMAAMLTEDDKQALRDRLTNKMGTVRILYY